ncbi:MAG: single-stranded DNA-binding protein [Candidatus Daviesbacteria bacterium]|nr:single-stranded DNA-binding protein [Candidatus Daviesbacteria bacterium]
MGSRSWNKVELIGNLTRDPELRYTPSGTAVATIGIATNRTFTSEGEKKEEVDFHKVIAWGKLAELCNQLMKKGSRVFVSGRLQYREWTGQDGNKRRDAEIVLEDMILITPKGEGDTGFVSEKVSGAPVGDVSLPEVSEKKEADSEPIKAEAETKPQEEATPAPNESVADEDLPF